MSNSTYKSFVANLLSQSIIWVLCFSASACQPDSSNIPSASEPNATQTSSPATVPLPEQPTPEVNPTPEPAIQTPHPNPVFRPIFPALKYQTEVPIFLPEHIPGIQSSEQVYAILETTAASNYQILLALTQDCRGGNACRLGSVSGQIASEAAPLEGQQVTLQNETTGYFVEATCGANCSDATLTWEQNGYRYTVGLKAGDEAALVEMANSAITNGAL